MKQSCLASTALASVGLMIGDASANGIRLEIGGQFESAAGGTVQVSHNAAVDTADVRDYVFKQDVEVDFLGSVTLDNGLTVGAVVEFDGQTSEDQVSSVYAYFSGRYGELRFGDTEEAYAQLCTLVPSASTLFGADSPEFNFSNAGIAGYAATNGTCYGIDDSSTKLVLFSPVIGGFQFAASFTPDNSEDTRNTLNGAGTRFDNDPDQNSENLSVAASYTQDFNGVGLVIGGGATFSFDKEFNPGNAEDARGYNAYAQVSLSELTIGAASELRENLGTDGSDQWVYGAGMTYEFDDLTIGLGWTRGNYEKAVGANGTGPFSAVHDIYSATASYELLPGLYLEGVIEYSDYRSHDAAGPDYQGLGFGAGTLIIF